MSNTKLTAVTLSVFVLMAAVSGGVTFAVLSDSQTVTVNLPAGVGNTPTNTTTTSTAETETMSADCGIGGTQHNGSGNGTVSIVLRPSDNQSITVNESVDYDVYVEGATDNVGSYNLNFTLCDPQVATFVNFTHTEATSIEPKTNVSSDEVVATGANGTLGGIDGPMVYLGTLTVAGNGTGQTELGVTDVGDGKIEIVKGEKAGRYNITSTDTTVLTVKEAESDNSGGNGRGN